MNNQWEDVETAIKDGLCEDAGVFIGEIIRELNDDLSYHKILLLTDGIEGEF